MTPRQGKRVNAAHFLVEAVVGFVADGNDGADAAGGLADEFGEVGYFGVAGNGLGIADAGVFPAFDYGFIDIDARNAQGAEEIAFAAFIHADSGREQLRVENRFVAQLGLLKNLRFESEFNKVLGSFALDDQLAAFVIDDSGFFFLPSEPGIGNVTKLVVLLVEQGL